MTPLRTLLPSPTHRYWLTKRKLQTHRDPRWDVNFSPSAGRQRGGAADGLALSREGKCQTVTHTAETDSSEP